MLKANATRIIVKQQPMPEATDSGIILQNPQELNPQAVAVSIGPKVTAEVVTGDHLLIDWRKTAKFVHEDQTYYLVDQSDVWCVFQRD